MRPEIVVAPRSALAQVFAAQVEVRSEAAIAARGGFTIAVPGGSVASAFFPRLAASEVDWTRARLLWVDERGVAPGDPASNFGAARDLLLIPGRVSETSVLRMPGERADLVAAAARYAQELETAAGAPPVLDVVLLGVGPDGHVASLFPGHPLLAEETATVAAVLDAPKPPARRLTLTLPVLTAARLVVVAAFGSEKAGVIAAALGDAGSALPVGLVLRRAATSLVLLDAAAAAGVAHHAAVRPTAT